MRKIFSVLSILLVMLLAGCRPGPSVPASYDSVAAITAEAARAFDSGEYSDALTKYAEAMKINPVDMDSLIGAVKCQIALGNFDMADMNLSAAVSVDPKTREICDLYLALSEASGQIHYARTAVLLARENNIESFLDRVPESPSLSCPDGIYDSKLEVEVSAADGAEIFVVEQKDFYRNEYRYCGPILITRGDTNLEVYCVRDGVPSETVTAHYQCDYAPVEVGFTDPVIEKMVRLTLSNAQGPVTDVDCEGITSLYQYDLRNAGMDWQEYNTVSVKSIEDIRLFPNLQNLYLENMGPIYDYTPLFTCRRLSSLQMDNSGLSDVSFAENLPNLEYFSARNNQISDLTPLSKCKNLCNLMIEGNPVSDLSVLKGLDLEYLYVSAARIKDLSVLSNWKDMRNLTLYGCGGLDLSPLRGMTQLRSLYLYAEDYYSNNYWYDRTPIGDISFLEKLTQLEYLNLDGLSDYEQLSVVKPMKNLIYFHARTINYSSMPEALRKELQSALPNCSISS